MAAQVPALLRTLVRASPPRNSFNTAPAHGPTPAYSLSKAALNALTRIAAAELPRPELCGVLISAVCPGDVSTRMCAAEHGEEGNEAPHEILSPQHAARDVVWLAAAGANPNDAAALPSGRFWRAREEIPL